MVKRTYSEEQLKRRKEYYLKNKEKISIRRRERYLSDKQKYLDKMKEYTTQIMQKDPEKIRAIKRKHKNKKKILARELVNQFKKQGCKFCNEKCISALDCHHINDNNKKSVARLVMYGYTTSRILQELRKCEVVCANCHRKYHDKPRKITRALRTWRYKLPKEIKESHGCKLCGEKFWKCLDFHHVDREFKVLNIGKMLRTKGITKQIVIDEIAKCEILCANCHRKYHSNDKMGATTKKGSPIEI